MATSGLERSNISAHEQEWIAKFIEFGGGDFRSAQAAYSRRWPNGSPTSTEGISGPDEAEIQASLLDDPKPPEPPQLAPKTVFSINKRRAEKKRQLQLQAQQSLPLDAETQKEYGFVTSTMIYAAMPHRAIKTGFYKRSDNYVTLSIMNDPDIGIPYGRYPRLLLAHINTLAKKTKERRIYLGESQADFYRKLGINPDSTGERGQVSLIKKSAIQLFTAAIRWRKNEGDQFVFKNLEVATEGSLIWTPHSTDGGIDKYRWQGYIDLSESFFEQCINHSYPIDLKVIQSFRSSVAIDIYIWLTYRMNSLKQNQKIKWRDLKFQFGSEYSDTPLGIRNFRSRFLIQLKLVLKHYPVNLDSTAEYLELKPSQSHIPKIG